MSADSLLWYSRPVQTWRTPLWILTPSFLVSGTMTSKDSVIVVSICKFFIVISICFYDGLEASEEAADLLVSPGKGK